MNWTIANELDDFFANFLGKFRLRQKLGGM